MSLTAEQQEAVPVARVFSPYDASRRGPALTTGSASGLSGVAGQAGRCGVRDGRRARSGRGGGGRSGREPATPGPGSSGDEPARSIGSAEAAGRARPPSAVAARTASQWVLPTSTGVTIGLEHQGRHPAQEVEPEEPVQRAGKRSAGRKARLDLLVDGRACERRAGGLGRRPAIVAAQPRGATPCRTSPKDGVGSVRAPRLVRAEAPRRRAPPRQDRPADPGRSTPVGISVVAIPARLDTTAPVLPSAGRLGSLVRSRGSARRSRRHVAAPPVSHSRHGWMISTCGSGIG
jgi:hypothetical protein